MSRELFLQALNALEIHTVQTRPIHNTELAIDALRAALAAPEPEPVAWGMLRADGLLLDVICPDEHEAYQGAYTVPLYAAPVVPAPAPDGWVMVPTHLTVDQLEAFVGHGLCCGTEPMPEAVIDAGHRWTRLLGRIAAAPEPTHWMPLPAAPGSKQ